MIPFAQATRAAYVTSNGALMFFALTLVATFEPSRHLVPVGSGLVVLAYLVTEGRKVAWRALRRTLLLCGPLIAFLYLLWTIYLGYAPTEVLFAKSGQNLTAGEYTLGISTRLIVMVMLVVLLAESFQQRRPGEFIRGLCLPERAKILLLLAISLSNTMIIAARRAHTALTSANVLTGRWSARNVLGLHWLIQATWLSSLAIAIERLDTKWRYEELPGVRLKNMHRGRFILSAHDVLWIGLAAVAMFYTLW